MSSYVNTAGTISKKENVYKLSVENLGIYV
jgi:hypothetical protein